MAIRESSAIWQGNLVEGKGSMRLGLPFFRTYREPDCVFAGFANGLKSITGGRKQQ